MTALFNSRKIYDLANAISSSIDNQINKMGKADFANSTIDELTEKLTQQNKLDIPKLLEQEIHMKKPEDVKINIDRRGYGGKSVDGTKYTFIIPFTGDSSLFGVFPSTYLSHLPTGDVYGSEIKIVFKVIVGNDTSRMKPEFDSNLETIKRYLGFLEDDINIFNGKLAPAIKASLARRKNKLDNDEETANSFGFPIR